MEEGISGISDLYSDHPDRDADGAERRSASEDREGQIRHLKMCIRDSISTMLGWKAKVRMDSRLRMSAR